MKHVALLLAVSLISSLHPGASARYGSAVEFLKAKLLTGAAVKPIGR